MNLKWLNENQNINQKESNAKNVKENIKRNTKTRERKKNPKCLQKKKLDNEINEHSDKLKQLYSLKNEFEKLENNVDDYFNPKQDD